MSEKMNEAIKHGIDFVLVSDGGVTVPEGWLFVCPCRAGHYYARPGVTREMIAAAVKTS